MFNSGKKKYYVEKLKILENIILKERKEIS